jgi:phosphoglycerate dehydrogenase-like enzyme
MTTERETLLIASWIESVLVGQIRNARPDIDVLYEPELLAPPRYAADHKGQDFARTSEQEERWLECLTRATILFDFDQTHLDDLPERAPHLRWIQATSAGIGQFVRVHGYAERMPRTVFTTARGVHAIPLAEFAVMSILMHTRGALHMIAEQQGARWARFAGTDAQDRTVVIVGMGAVGREIAARAHAFGMHVVGVRRSPRQPHAEEFPVDRMIGPNLLQDVLPQTDFLVLAAPHTDETEGMIGALELAELPHGAVLVNVGRGALVDESALIEALRSHRLSAAYLDVFREEPLPPESPLWTMSNVLISPHSASTSDRENERIVALFCENLRRDREGKPLLNVLDPARLY